MSDANPYQPPKEVNEPIQLPKERQRLGVMGILLKFVALGLWSFALTIVVACFPAFNTPEMVARRVLTPGFFWYVTMLGLGLPLTSMVLFGIACWRRSKPFAYAGLGAMALMALNLLGIATIGAVRRWLAG